MSCSARARFVTVCCVGVAFVVLLMGLLCEVFPFCGWCIGEVFMLWGKCYNDNTGARAVQWRLSVFLPLWLWLLTSLEIEGRDHVSWPSSLSVLKGMHTSLTLLSWSNSDYSDVLWNKWVSILPLDFNITPASFSLYSRTYFK